MKKSVMMLVLLMFGLLLVACSDGNVSNQQLKTDILNLEEIKDQSAKLNSLTIIERSGNTPIQEIKVSASVDYYDYEMTVDVWMSYEKKEAIWSLTGHTVTIIKVVPKSEPILSTGLKNVIALTSESIIDHFTLTDQDPVYTIASIDKDLEHGKASLIVEETYTVLTYTVQAHYMIDATYIRNSGWNYTMTDWELTENLDWNGIYDLELTDDNAQYPGLDPNLIYHLGERIEGIEITGTLSRTRTMADPEHGVTQSSVRVRFDYDGQQYDLTPSENDYVYGFLIQPSDDPYMDLYFYISYNETAKITPKYRVDAGEFFGNLVKRP